MDDRERQLEAEGAQRQRIALFALAGGVLYLLGELLYALLITAKTPGIGFIQGLTPALHGHRIAAIDPRTIDERFLNHHIAEAIVIWFVIAVGLTAMRWPLLYLRQAEVTRGGINSKVTRAAASIAPPLLGLAVLVLGISVEFGAHSYITHTARDYSALTAATAGPFRLVIAILAELGQLGMAVAFVLVSLRAMRAGLLTRLIGTLGIICGVLFIIPIVPIPLLQFLWLTGVALMLLELGGQVLPPAWAAGEAIPWVRQPAAAGSRSGRSSRGGRVAPAPSVPAVAAPLSSSKRKRRRD
jgi:hypothetical protein